MDGFAGIVAGILSPEWREDRSALSRAAFLFLFAYQGGVCDCGCNRPLFGPYRIRDEHIIPRFNHVEGGRNLDALDNRRLYLEPCSRQKDKADAKDNARTRRLSGGRGSQYARRKAKGAQISGRGFDKRFRKKMNGEVIPR